MGVPRYVSVEEVTTGLSDLLRRVEAGDTVVVTRDSTPIAEIRPVRQPRRRRRPYGLCAGQFVVPDDFDDPLPEDILRPFTGE